MEVNLGATTNESGAGFGDGSDAQVEGRNPSGVSLLQEEEREVSSPSASTRPVIFYQLLEFFVNALLLVGGVTSYGWTTLQRCWQRWCYVLVIALGSLAWTLVHSYFVIWKNDSNLTMRQDSPPYAPVYAAAFCLPSVDGVVNLLFAQYELYRSRKDGQALTVGSDSLLNDRVFVVALLCTLLVFVSRVLVVWLWLEWGVWLLLGLLIEVIPHIAPFIVMYDETSKMAGKLQKLSNDILANNMDPRKCINEYTSVSKLVQSRSTRWQVFIVLSVGMEVYVVVFQTLFAVFSASEYKDSEKISLNVTSFTLVEGCYMVFKLWPIVRYNEKATTFAKKFLLMVEEKREKSPNELPSEGEEAEKFERSVWTTSMLFSTNPPCLTIFTFVVDKLTIMAMTLSVTFAAISRHLWKSAHV